MYTLSKEGVNHVSLAYTSVTAAAAAAALFDGYSRAINRLFSSLTINHRLLIVILLHIKKLNATWILYVFFLSLSLTIGSYTRYTLVGLDRPTHTLSTRNKTECLRFLFNSDFFLTKGKTKLRKQKKVNNIVCFVEQHCNNKY